MAGDYLTNWQDIQSKWDQAQKDGVFAKAKKPYNPAPTKIMDYVNEDFNPADFGMSPAMAALAGNSENMSDADYWAAVAQIARVDVGQPTPRRAPDADPDPEPRYDSSKAEILQEAGSIATPNPVDATTLGPDYANENPPDWSGDAITRLAKMKLELHELGSKIAGLGTTWQEKPREWDEDTGRGAMKELCALQRRIDDLSDSLSPGTVKKYYRPCGNQPQ